MGDLKLPSAIMKDIPDKVNADILAIRESVQKDYFKAGVRPSGSTAWNLMKLELEKNILGSDAT